MSEHTPGPWRAAIGPEEQFPHKGNVYGGGYIVAAIGEGFPNAEANARLIAAAPELLEAAHNTLELLELLRRDNAIAGNHYGALKAGLAEAIANAEGR